MPKPKLTDEIEKHGKRFRLHRITGFEAFEAKATWAGIAGDNAAMLMALGNEAAMAFAAKTMSERQRERLDAYGPEAHTRGLMLLAIVQVMRRGMMDGRHVRALAEAFILGHVEVAVGERDGETDWVMIKTTDDLDSRMDGSHDGDTWHDLLWEQIPFCLGPTTAIGDMSPDSPPMAPTSSE